MTLRSSQRTITPVDPTNPSRVRGVIFDLDGTLADTLEDITAAINVCFEQSGLPSVSIARIRSLIGWGLRNLFSKASGIDEPHRIDTLVHTYRPIYVERMLRHTRIYAGIDDLLARMTADRVPMAVYSNKPDEFTVPMCASLLRPYRFVCFRGVRDGATRKPDPTVAFELARAMDRTPEEVLFVGDSPTDILTAEAAGMTSVAVTWGYRDRAVLEEARPHHVIARPEALWPLLFPH